MKHCLAAVVFFLGCKGTADRNNTLDKPAAGGVVTAAGAAYFGITGVGVAQFSDGRASTLIDHSEVIHDMVALPNGEIIVLGAEGLWSLHDGTARKLSNNIKHFSHAAVSRTGELWAINYEGAAHWVNGEWIAEPVDDTFGEAIPVGIAITPDNVVWAANRHSLFNNASGKWQPVTGPQGDNLRFTSVVVAADGALYLSTTRGIYKYAHHAWSNTQWRPPRGNRIRPDYEANEYEELVVGVDGTIAGSGGPDEFMIASPVHGVRFTSISQLKLAAKHAVVQAVDGAGRVWIATDNGLLVLNNDASLAKYYPAGTIPGINGSLESAVVVAGGPRLPEVQPAVVGQVTGRVTRAGRPVVGSTVELCPTPMTLFDESTSTPCRRATLVRTASTGADGEFVLAKIPVGTYRLAINVDGKWRTLGTDCCSGIKAGETWAVREIVLDE